MTIALIIDITALCIACTLLLKYGRMSHSHPASVYLFFHIFAVSLRLLALAAGAPPLFADWPSPIFRAVTLDEICRASLIADIVLLMMVAGWIRAARKDGSRSTHRNLTRGRDLSPKHILTISAIAFPIGVLSLLSFSRIEAFSLISLNLGEWSTSSWISMTKAWAGLSLVALIYWYGFRIWLSIPMLTYLVIIGLQGYHRYRLLIIACLLIQIYLDRKRLTWPGLKLTTVAFCLILIFFPLKHIGEMVQEGAKFSEISDRSTEILLVTLSGERGDQQVLDQLASALTLIDESGKFHYGSTYLSLVTLPIPRQLWSSKPGLVEYFDDFVTPERPMRVNGMVVTFIGEIYANFWYLGLVAIPYFMAYSLGKFYFRAYQSPFKSLIRFSYLLVACNLIQVYRDGLISLVMFTFVNMMPLMMIILLHFALPKRRKCPNLQRSFVT